MMDQMCGPKLTFRGRADSMLGTACFVLFLLVTAAFLCVTCLLSCISQFSTIAQMWVSFPSKTSWITPLRSYLTGIYVEGLAAYLSHIRACKILSHSLDKSLQMHCEDYPHARRGCPDILQRVLPRSSHQIIDFLPAMILPVLP